MTTSADAPALAAIDPDQAIADLFFSEAGLDAPETIYHRLRDVAPEHRLGEGATFLTRFDDCQRILRSNLFGKPDRDGRSQMLPGADPEAAAFRRQLAKQAIDRDQPQSMLFLNPPDHTRQRSLVQRAFTPRRVEELRSGIAGLADAAVQRVVEAGSGDLLDLLAFPLPVAVIGTMVGVPEADWPQFRELITASAVGLEPSATLADLKQAEAANADVWAYFIDLVAERRARPKDDLLSDLLAVKSEDDQLSEGEVIAVAIILFAAGFETTTNLIGNGMGALLRHPDQMALLWSDPTLIDGAVEEILRWDSPVQLDSRRAMEDTEFNGKPVAAGRQFVTLLGAANRDPARFTDPDRFDITRNDGTPLSFAAGIHHCLGANLARAEGHEVFRALIEQCATMDLDGELRRRPRMTLRGYEAVPITVTPR